ncbi:odorant receptor 45a-like [Haematobia irritans]|uniref:odorant receptor 45a-like n=1 Tax=Haematobia irritans TaxID=7368 RepID=UPI003F4F6D76
MASSLATDTLKPNPAIKNYFHIQRITLQAVGVNLTSIKNPVFSRFLLWVPNMIQLILCWPMTHYALQHLDDLNKFTDALAPVWQVVMAVVLLLHFIWNMENAIKLLIKVWMWNFQVSDEELKIIQKENHRDYLLSLTFYCIVCTTGIMALVAPFVVASYYSWQGFGFWEYLDTPLKAVYFMDPKASLLGYMVAYLWDAIAVYAVFYCTLAVDTLFSWLTHNICAHFRILDCRFKSAAAIITSMQNSDSLSDLNFRKALSNCVSYHQNLIWVMDQFNDVFRMMVFVKFAISCIQLAFLAFQFARGGDLAGQVFHLFFLLSVSSQLMLYCYGGQRLKDVSSDVASGIYEYFQWEELSIKYKKLLLIPLVRAQKPCGLTGIFFVADLELFLWVYRTAASVITMLMTLADEE